MLQNEHKTSLLLTKLGGENISKCNLCGRDLGFFDINEDFSWSKRLGYGTKYDGDYLDLHLCCECLEKIVDKCAVNPIIEN